MLTPSKNAICTSRPSSVSRVTFCAMYLPPTIEDHVHAAHCGVRLHLSDEILFAVINDHIRAECATELCILVIADRGKHRGAIQLGELDGRVADAAGPPWMSIDSPDRTRPRSIRLVQAVKRFSGNAAA